MTVKRLWPIYMLAKRPIINGIKIKTISLNSYTNIKSNMDETRGFFAPLNPKNTSPQLSTPTWHWKIQQNFQNGLHVTLWRLRPEVRVHSQAWKLHPEIRVHSQAWKLRLEVCVTSAKWRLRLSSILWFASWLNSRAALLQQWEVRISILKSALLKQSERCVSTSMFASLQ